MQATRGSLRAVCVGRPRDVEWRGESLRTGIFKTPVAGRVFVGPEGLRGDGQADRSVHGGREKAVYAYDEASADYWQAELGRSELGPGAFGENLRLSGWPEDCVCIGDRLRIGTATLEVSQPRQPCAKLGMRFDDPTFPKRFLASGRVGYYLRVLEPGEIEAGDEVERIERGSGRIDVRSLVALWRDRAAPRDALEAALSLEALAEAWRGPLRERWARAQGEGRHR
jgi:MOSC domain-containing protein YiiM